MARKHTVAQGECLSRIARHYGLADYRRIYEHPDNAGLRKQRPNPNLLYPGDVLVIPETETKAEPCATDQHHAFRAKVPRRWLRIAVEDEDNKRLANQRYNLQLDDIKLSGTTDGNGIIEHKIRFDCEKGVLSIGKRKWKIYVAHLNPMEDDTSDEGVSGVQGRLRNLGYDVGPIDGVLGPKSRRAIRFFQADEQLEQSGEPDAATRQKLMDVHGC
jgi:N-acetylmuramoyl-L-alanine amidase